MQQDVTPAASVPSPPEPPVIIVIGRNALPAGVLDALSRAISCRIERVTSLSSLNCEQRRTRHGCLVLDVTQLESDEILLPRAPGHLPIICITDAGNVSLSVRAMKAGAIDVLTKPVRRAPLLDAVHQALNRNQKALRQEAELKELRERYASLSRREREVMGLVTFGLLNRQVAAQLRISEVTVKAHRGGAMRKMKAASLASLVIMAARLHIIQGEQFTLSAEFTPPTPRRAEECHSRCYALGL